MVAALIIHVALQQRRSQRGASLFEFAVMVAILAILLTVLLQRISYYQGEAERVAVMQVVSNVRVSLQSMLAQRNLPGRSVNLLALAEQNPLDWLHDKPANYSGAMFSPSDKDIGAGRWCFDRRDKTLVYLLNNGNSFTDAHAKRLKYKVKLLRLPQSTVKPASTSLPDGAAFEQVDG